MANVATIVVNTATVTLTTSLFGALANVAAVTYGAVNNTNVQLVICDFLAQGLRHAMDFKLSTGQAGVAGITVPYIESNVKANSE